MKFIFETLVFLSNNIPLVIAFVFHLITLIVLILTLSIFVYNAYLTRISIEQQFKRIQQQENLNRSMLRPWVYTEPSSTIRVKESHFEIFMTLRNIGSMPALNCLYFIDLTRDSNFPLDTLRDTLVNPNVNLPQRGGIFPNQSNVLLDWKIYKDPDGNALPQSTSDIVHKLESYRLCTTFLHVYVEYSNDLAFRATYQVNNIGSFNIYGQMIPNFHSSQEWGGTYEFILIECFLHKISY